jgi:hypothetical protein
MVVIADCAIDCRINFSEERLAVCSPTYEALQRQCFERSDVNVRQLELGFGRWTDYTRTDELVRRQKMVSVNCKQGITGTVATGPEVVCSTD